MSSKKKCKIPCSFARSQKPSKSKAFEFIRYIVQASQKLKTKAKTNLQTRTQKSHGRTIVAGNRLQENLVNRQSLARKSCEISFLPVLSRGCDFVGESFRMLPGLVHLGLCPVETSIAPQGIRAKISLLTLLLASGGIQIFRQE